MANERFDCIISNVRNGISVADIGCDHAYVSCKLVKLGISNRVYASDVRKGPLECAEANIAKCGYKNFIETHLRDGLDGIEEFSPDDIIIAGMGGELISRIIDKSVYVRNKNVHLILQPMTCSYELRVYLSQNGFEILDESLCRDSGKIYEIILCAYTGIPYTLSELSLHIGIKTRKEPLFKDFLLSKINKFTHILNGKRSSSADTSKEEELINELKGLTEHQL